MGVSAFLLVLRGMPVAYCGEAPARVRSSTAGRGRACDVRNAARAGLVLALAAGIVFAASVARAVDVPIVNASFEDTVVPNPTGIVSGLPNGWLAYSDAPLGGTFYGTLHAAPTNYTLGAPDGTNVPAIFIAAGGTSGVAFGIRQVLTTTLVADTLYTLEVQVGNIASGFNDLPNTPMDPGDDSFFDLSGYNGYRIELLVDDGASGVLLAQDVDSGAAIADGEFQLRSLTYDSTGVDAGLVGLPLEIRLIQRNLVDPAFASSDRETNFDDVRLSADPAPPSVPLSPFAAGASAVAIAAIAAWRLRDG